MQISSTPWHDMHIGINIGLAGTIGIRKDLPGMDQRDLANPGRPSRRNLDYLAHPGHLDCLRADKSYKTVD
ncbi:hypothetical protein HGM15179_000807 [Zosterops borbonicus]|uniref:Uncharacterized protein n=1 Tax=Zosterops borbonicus TaxID=364589 RepID=A0A8K1LTE5_9PASS|nr:hypothetical protein HGM15179_000807 [Zosterops borbonicus]